MHKSQEYKHKQTDFTLKMSLTQGSRIMKDLALCFELNENRTSWHKLLGSSDEKTHCRIAALKERAWNCCSRSLYILCLLALLLNITYKKVLCMHLYMSCACTYACLVHALTHVLVHALVNVLVPLKKKIRQSRTTCSYFCWRKIKNRDGLAFNPDKMEVDHPCSCFHSITLPGIDWCWWLY